MAVQAKLLEVLVCPACKGPLTQARWNQPSQSPAEAPPDVPLIGLDCPHCKLRYPIIDDIPVMLIDQAQRI
jgi:uncharacterized protein